VYQSANHTRLEHSLGVAHLAEEWACQLLARSVEDGSRGCTSGIVSPSDPEWRQDVQLVSLAGRGLFGVRQKGLRSHVLVTL
jgi:HD superfamily phosphohydrolase